MAPNVLVFSRKTQGLQGDPEQFGMPPLFPFVPLLDALTAKYNYDAHLCLYTMPNEWQAPRVNKTGYGFLRDSGVKILIDKIFIDVDNPNHEPWESEAQIEDAYAKVKATEIAKNAGFYATRRGFRLFWSLPEPIDAIYYESFINQFLARLLEEGIIGDKDCCDWTRLFRLPFATPEGDLSPLSLPFDFEYGDLLWKPSTLTEGRVQKIRKGIGLDWSDAPPPVVPPLPADYEALKGEKEIYNRIKKGQPLAEPGSRNTTMTRAVSLLVNRSKNPDPNTIYRALAYSVAVDSRTTQQNGAAPSLDNLWNLCKQFCAKTISERLESDEIKQQIVELANERSALSGRVIDVEDTQKMLETEEIPDEHDDAISIPLNRRCVLTFARNYYVLNQKNALYEGPFDATNVPAMIEKYCPSIAPPIRNDKMNLVSMPEILTRCGTEIRDMTAVIGKRGKKFILSTQTLEEGVACVRSDLRPRYHADIDKWLRLVGGAQAEKLLDWLATFIELDKPTCGLYLKSDGGSGKGMLANGLARLFGSAPTMYQNIIGTHNDGLAVCPLVWADEEIPPSQHGKTPSAVFRTLVGNSVFNLRRMYAPPATLRGCLRLLVTANNNNALKIHEDLTPEDYQAIVDRIGYIQVGPQAKKYLESIGGRETTEKWVAGDGIAEHTLWLAKNRVVVRDARFLVKGWESTMHKHLQVTSGMAGNAVEVIAYAIAKSPVPNGFELGNNLIYVTVPAVAGIWAEALGDAVRNFPTKQRISSALQQIAAHPDCIRVVVDDGFHKSTVPMWALRPNEIIAAIDRYQLGDAEQIAQEIATRVVPTL